MKPAGARRVRALCAAWLLILSGRPGAAGGSELLSALHGRWHGEGVQILIDTERMQGNLDPTKPFTRNPFVIRDVTPPWVVFTIGNSSIVARVEGETMMVTQPGWPTPRMLTRLPDSRPPPPAPERP
ncbi:MAG TPA: hypothetical protein VHL98_05355 [Microvirga sp.]|nr:hypothetical protein [Microvirga sp.]